MDAAVMNEMIYAFEQRHGLSEEGEKPPRSSAQLRELKEDEKRRERLAHRAEVENKRTQRNRQMSTMDSIWIRPVPTRPDTAPVRMARAQAAQKRNEDLYAMWYSKYREEVEHHAVSVGGSRTVGVK